MVATFFFSVHDPSVPYKNKEDRNANSRKRWAENRDKLRAYHREKTKQYREAMTPEQVEARRAKDREIKNREYRQNKSKFKARAAAIDPKTGRKKTTVATLKSRAKMIAAMTPEQLEEYRERQRSYWRKYGRGKGLIRLRRHGRKRRLNPMNRVIDNLRTISIRFMMGRNRTERLRELIGMTPEQLRVHIENQFTAGMTWENFGRGLGKWNVDHRIPLTHFKNLGMDVEEQKIAFSYRNLSPKWFTQAEIDEGWHFCAEFDGLLVKGDPREPHCGDSCVDGVYAVKLSDSNPFA
jgi:hypothetical protein